MKQMPARRARTPVHKISLGEAHGGYAASEQNIIEGGLRELGLYGTEFAYTAFDPLLKGTVLKKGSPHADSLHPDDIDCCVVDSPSALGMPGIRDNDSYDLLHYLKSTSNNGDKAAFAVYRMAGLTQRNGHPYYRFLEPDKKLEALAAVVDVTW